MNIFGKKKKAAEAEALAAAQFARPRPYISLPLELGPVPERVRTCNKVAYPAQQRRWDAPTAPLPPVPGQDLSELSSYKRAPLQGDRPAVLPTTVNSRLTPPSSDTEADFADEGLGQTPKAAQPAPSDQDAYDGIVQPRPRRAGPPQADPSRRRGGPAPTASSSRLQSIASQMNEPEPPRRPTPPLTPGLSSLSPISEDSYPPVAPSRSTSDPYEAPPPRPLLTREPSSFRAAPFAIEGMRWHAEPVAGQINAFAVELRFNVRVNSAQTRQ